MNDSEALQFDLSTSCSAPAFIFCFDFLRSSEPLVTLINKITSVSGVRFYNISV